MAYRVRGIKDSEKEGWYKTNPDCPQCCTSRIEVDTPLGTIIAEVSSDQSYPGIWLSFASAKDLNDDGTPWERTIALLEASSDQSVELKVWADKRQTEDYTDVFPVEHA